MTKLEELLEMWRKDAQIDRTQPNLELINIPQLHSKYLTIMSKHRLQSKEAEFKFNKYKKIRMGTISICAEIRHYYIL